MEEPCSFSHSSHRNHPTFPGQWSLWALAITGLSASPCTCRTSPSHPACCSFPPAPTWFKCTAPPNWEWGVLCPVPIFLGLFQSSRLNPKSPLLCQLEWLKRKWVRKVLSPGLTLLPKAAESWTDLGTQREPPPALQGNLLGVVDVPYGFGETAPWPRFPPSLLLPFPWDPALPFFLQELPRDAGNSLFPPGWLGAPALPTPAPENTATTRGQEKPWGQRSCMEQAHGREAAEWNGIHRRKPRPPCLHWLGALCCWRSVPLTRHQFELSDALVGVCAGSKLRSHVPKPNPRAVVAAHSSEIFLKQTAGHRSSGCPLPGTPRVHRLQTPAPLGGPGSALWLSLVGLLCSQGC